ncbi:MAG: ribonuclease inhibitor, partial [Bacteroidota bacterium]|nr:ribonuclease inhibitor [Bacteroidota bacterium]
FSTLLSFYSEVEKVFTKDLGWKIGRNLDAFNDILRGGFGVHDYEEPVRLIWLHSGKSQEDLGWEETVKYLSAKLTTCHPSNTESVKKDLILAKTHAGKTIFELIIDIIERHDHIELSLQ